MKEGYKVLEVGAGSGYHAATIAEIAAPLGKEGLGHIYTMEVLRELAEHARENLERAGYADRVTVITGDGSLGYEVKAPYDRVSVTAASPEVPPPLLRQLARGGLLVIPVGSLYSYQSLQVVRKDL